MQAIEQLHCSEGGITWLHNDIKPENILVRGQEAVLIDLGTAREPGVGACMGTAGYIAPDLIDGADLDYCPSGDIFALGVTLFEWLTGEKPYEKSQVGKSPLDCRQLRPNLPEPVASWLECAIETDTAERFTDVKSMRAAFEHALQEEAGIPDREPLATPELPPTELPRDDRSDNPFVAYLNTLHNMTSGNENALAESQARNPFFGHIHVPLKATDYILDTVGNPEKRNVILTGHAGDGKSIIALEVYKRLRNLPLSKPLDEDLGPIETAELPNKGRLIIIKDMSELTTEEKTHHLKAACAEGPECYLIISNTGALLEAFEAHFGGGHRWAEEQGSILASLSDNAPHQLPIDGGHFEVINLAMVDNLQTAIELLKRIVGDECWQKCREWNCWGVCPVYLNAKLIRENWEIVSERVQNAYLRLFEYGERLTMRQISAHLSFAITCGLDCDGIRAMTHLPNPPPQNEFLFSNRFFGEGSSGTILGADQLKAVRLLRSLDLGKRPFPTLEHRLWGRNKDDELSINLPSDLEPLFSALRSRGCLQVLPEGGDGVQPRAARHQLRRMIYFFGQLSGELADFIPVFLGSTALTLYAHWHYAGQWKNQLEREMIRKGILHVLLEQFTGVRLPEDAPIDDIYITLNRGRFEIRQSAQIVLARFSGQDFLLELRRGDSRVGAMRHTPVLVKQGAKVELPLELPFLDYVLMRHAGELGQRLHASYVDRLERFKSDLLSLPEAVGQKTGDMLLVRLRTNNRFVTQRYSINAERSTVEVY